MSTSTYSLPDLLRKWAKSELTVEQAIGHILQHLVALSSQCTDQDKAAVAESLHLEQPSPRTP